MITGFFQQLLQPSSPSQALQLLPKTSKKTLLQHLIATSPPHAPPLPSEVQLQPKILLSPSGNSYTLTDKLSEGDDGTIYKATCVMQGLFDKLHNVTIKISCLSPLSRQSQRREESLIFSLNQHEQNGIVKIFDRFTFNKRHYTVFESFTHTLQFLIDERKRGPLVFSQIREIAQQLIEALIYLSSENTIHGNLKPENIVFTDDRFLDLRLINFHMASTLYPCAWQNIQSPPYRAPEVALGMTYDAAADMWSLGCLLSELYTGSQLFPAKENKNARLENQGVLLEIAKKMGAISKMTLEGSRYCQNIEFIHEMEKIGYQNQLMAYLERPQHLQSLEDSDAFQSEKQAFLDFIRQMIVVDPDERMCCKEALQHPFITDVVKKEYSIATPLDDDDETLEVDPEQKN